MLSVNKFFLLKLCSFVFQGKVWPVPSSHKCLLPLFPWNAPLAGVGQEKKTVDSRYWAVSYTNVFRWSYSSEAALILLARLVTHMWVITCGWERALWSVLPCCVCRSIPTPKSATVVSGQITSHVTAVSLLWIAGMTSYLREKRRIYPVFQTDRCTLPYRTIKNRRSDHQSFMDFTGTKTPQRSVQTHCWLLKRPCGNTHCTKSD